MNSLLVISLLLFSCTLTSILEEDAPIVAAFKTRFHEIFLEEICGRLLYRDGVGLKLTCRLFCGLVVPRARLSDAQEEHLFWLLQRTEPALEHVQKLLPAPWYSLDMIKADGKGVLYWAIYRQNSFELLRLLHRKGASLKNAPALRPLLDCLMFCGCGYEALEYILEQGCVLAVHGEWNFLYTVALMNSHRTYNLLDRFQAIPALINVPNENDQTPIFASTNIAMSRALLASGADPLHLDLKKRLARHFYQAELRTKADESLVELLKLAEDHQEMKRVNLL